jgi:hypothetical protein
VTLQGEAALTGHEVDQTAGWIASVQLPNGMIPWFPGGHGDPWNHVEAAMALSVAGWRLEAERGFEWLASCQLADGSWCRYYLAEGVEDPRRDPNVTAYVASGVWWHHLVHDDAGFVEAMWPVVEAAVEFALSLQQPGGEVLWSMDPDGTRARYALLTSTSSIHHSVRCASSIATYLGRDKPHWEIAAVRMAEAIARRPGSFAPKQRWAMDWYYPVLCGALPVEEAERRIDEHWSRFVLEGLGVRCVSDQPWVTAAETAECVMALDSLGMSDRAEALLAGIGHMRDDDGAYWTGCVHPQCVRYPGGERTTYSAGAVIVADHVVKGATLASQLFRSLPGQDVTGQDVTGQDGRMLRDEWPDEPQRAARW